MIGLGAKDFNVTATKSIRTTAASAVEKHPTAKGLYMPDSVALYHWLGIPFLVMANEGDFREDNDDRARGSELVPLHRPR